MSVTCGTVAHNSLLVYSIHFTHNFFRLGASIRLPVGHNRLEVLVQHGGVCLPACPHAAPYLLLLLGALLPSPLDDFIDVHLHSALGHVRQSHFCPRSIRRRGAHLRTLLNSSQLYSSVLFAVKSCTLVLALTSSRSHSRSCVCETLTRWAGTPLTASLTHSPPHSTSQLL